MGVYVGVPLFWETTMLVNEYLGLVEYGYTGLYHRVI